MSGWMIGEDVFVTCGHCSGDGHTLDERASQMLARLQPDSWAPTKGLATKLRIKPSNAANILARLLEWGLVARRGSGSRHSPYEWRRA